MMTPPDALPLGRAVLVGLIGAGIQASRTPAMHELEGAALGLRTIYKLIDLDALGLPAAALPDLVTAAERLGFAGLNITHPCKQSVIPLMTELSPDAAALGAVNTVVFDRGRRVGHNTDWWGFAESFKRTLTDAPRGRVVQFGAGGGGSAVAYALLSLGVESLDIADLDRARAGSLADSLSARFGAGRCRPVEDLAASVRAADGIVNSTPMGMASYPGTSVQTDLLQPSCWVADIVYFPLETELLRAARARGCRTMSGAGMAIFQAIGAFRLFTGVEPDADRMARHFETAGRAAPVAARRDGN